MLPITLTNLQDKVLAALAGPLTFISVNSAFLLSLVSIVALLLYLLEYRHSQKLFSEMEAAKLEKAEEKGLNLLHRAMQKAQSILGKAELDSIKVIAGSRFTTKKIEEKYQQELEDFVKQLETNLNTKMCQSDEEFKKYLTDLAAAGTKAQEEQTKLTQQKVNELFEKFEASVADFLTQTESRSMSSIELELKAARQLIDTYKTEQLKLIDENIVAMLEKTLSLVLAKKLSLKDQMDLIYEALEKAKVEKFIV